MTSLWAERFRSEGLPLPCRREAPPGLTMMPTRARVRYGEQAKTPGRLHSLRTRASRSQPAPTNGTF
jgi:hypothetical protein